MLLSREVPNHCPWHHSLTSMNWPTQSGLDIIIITLSTEPVKFPVFSLNRSSYLMPHNFRKIVRSWNTYRLPRTWVQSEEKIESIFCVYECVLTCWGTDGEMCVHVMCMCVQARGWYLMSSTVPHLVYWDKFSHLNRPHQFRLSSQPASLLWGPYLCFLNPGITSRLPHLHIHIGARDVSAPVLTLTKQVLTAKPSSKAMTWTI